MDTNPTQANDSQGGLVHAYIGIAGAAVAGTGLDPAGRTGGYTCTTTTYNSMIHRRVFSGSFVLPAVASVPPM